MWFEYELNRSKYEKVLLVTHLVFENCDPLLLIGPEDKIRDVRVRQRLPIAIRFKTSISDTIELWFRME